MRKSWGMTVAVPLVCATLAVGCGGSDGENTERRAQGPQTATPEQQSAQATVSLTGCVEPAPGTKQYILRNVHFVGQQASDPQRTTTTPGPHGITEGAFVRLAAGDQDLAGHLGQRVTVSGVVVDNGQNTIGTSGTDGARNPSGDTSQAAQREHHSSKVKEEAGRIGRESMADGTAAQIRVQQVQASGERCQQEAPTESRK
jgi:hypothetical protein